MARECPSCHRISQLETPYCPACGAPMTAESVQQEQNARVNHGIAALLPMKWHKFLTWVYLPWSIINNGINLYNQFVLIRDFDAAEFSSDLMTLAKCTLGLNMALCLALVPILLLAEIGLLKMQKRGPKILLANFLLQSLYGVANIALLAMANVDFFLSLVATTEMVLMYILNRKYYRNRQDLFT